MSISHSWKMNLEICVFAQKVNVAGNTEFVTHIWPRPFLWHSTISVVTFFFSSYLLSRRVTLENCSLFEAIYRNSKSHPCPFLTYLFLLYNQFSFCFFAKTNHVRRIEKEQNVAKMFFDLVSLKKNLVRFVFQ